MITVRFPAMACSHRILAEGASLDHLINFILLVFSATALPGVLGFVVLLVGRFRPPAAYLALILGSLTVVSAGFCFGWMCWERAAWEYYLASGLPLLLGLVTCGLAWRSCKRSALPTRATAPSAEHP